MLFSAFEKHQYYNIKDLVDITKQPVVRLESSVITHLKQYYWLKKLLLHLALILKNIISYCLFFFSDLLEGNPAWYWHLQCEGNTQEHLGAQARVQALPRRGKDWWIVFESKGQYMLSTQRRDFLLDQSLVWPGFCTSGLKMHWTMRWSFAVPSHSVGTKIKGTMEKSEVRHWSMHHLFLMWFPFTAWVCSLVF